MCADCHTPRDPQGAFIRSQWLHGAAIDFAPQHPMPWATFAPRLAGLPAGYSAEQLASFLQTGQRPDGSRTKPPMPPYRFSPEDARAVVDYLRDLR